MLGLPSLLLEVWGCYVMTDLVWEDTPENIRKVAAMRGDVLRATIAALYEVVKDSRANAAAERKPVSDVYYEVIHGLTTACFENIPNIEGWEEHE